jgi:integrase
MRNRKQHGQIVRIGDRWYVRYWERRNVSGTIERKRVSYQLGQVTTRGKRPPADIVDEAERYMATVNSGTIGAEQIVTISDFAEQIYLPWVEQYKRPSTAKGYRDIWEVHLKPLCGTVWLKDTRTFHVQGWLDQVAVAGKLSRNTLKHIKSVVSGMFTLAKQQDYFRGENPSRDTAIDPRAAEPQETYAYSLEELQTIISLLPEPAATAFAVAAYMGLRHGEIQGLLWENYRDGEMYVSRSIWNGRIGEPKTRKGRAPVPVIRQLAERLELHRLRCGNPQVGPIFANAAGKPLALTSVVNRAILPVLNRCERCGKAELKHAKTDHEYKRDGRIPEWHGWHAARRGLGSNLYRLGVPDIVIQRILRHANVSTTATYYIKTAADDVRNAMAKLEHHITESARTQSNEVEVMVPVMSSEPSTIQ